MTNNLKIKEFCKQIKKVSKLSLQW